MQKYSKETIHQTLGRKTIHPFPARMAPGIILEAFGKNCDKLKVLDPMAGSGTVLAVAKANGHRVFGYDSDPLAVLLSKVWTSSVDDKIARSKAVVILNRAKKIFKSMRVSEAYPHGSNEETQQFIRFWYDEYARKQLAALSICISRVRDAMLRDLLWVAFSRLIITKKAGASLAMDLSHSRPHKKYSRAPVKPFQKFLEMVDYVVKNCPQKSAGKIGPAATISLGDARSIPLKDNCIDLVVTSPPYANAIDYLRCSKFSLVWMGFQISELRSIRSENIGTENSQKPSFSSNNTQSIDIASKSLGNIQALPNSLRGCLQKYVEDMSLVVSEISRVIRPGGSVVFVIGDSTLRGVYVRNSLALEKLSETNGLKIMSRETREIPPNRRYMPPPRNGDKRNSIEKRMREEVILKCQAVG
jgi:DNA modification methylase